MLLWRIRFADFEQVNGRWNTLLPWSKSMHLRIGSRSYITFKTKFYVATVNNSFQPLPNFCHKELLPRCFIGLKLNIVTSSTKILTVMRGTTHMIWRKYQKLTLLNALKIPFQRFFKFFAFNIKWIKWG